MASYGTHPVTGATVHGAKFDNGGGIRFAMTGPGHEDRNIPAGQVAIVIASPFNTGGAEVCTIDNLRDVHSALGDFLEEHNDNA